MIDKAKRPAKPVKLNVINDKGPTRVVHHLFVPFVDTIKSQTS